MNEPESDERSLFERMLFALFGNEVAVVGSYRGHRTVMLFWETPDDQKEGEWDDGTYSARMYADTGVDIRLDPRPCAACGLPVGINDPDPCLGMVDGATYACCGHRCLPSVDHAYVSFEDGLVLRGDDALRWYKEHGIGPDVVSDESGRH